MADEKKDQHGAFAKKVADKLPREHKSNSEVVAGKGGYTLIKVGGRTVASVRNRNVRVTFPHDLSAGAAESLASMVAAAADNAPKEGAADEG